jgi:hypothetical protein
MNCAIGTRLHGTEAACQLTPSADIPIPPGHAHVSVDPDGTELGQDLSEGATPINFEPMAPSHISVGDPGT